MRRRFLPFLSLLALAACSKPADPPPAAPAAQAAPAAAPLATPAKPTVTYDLTESAALAAWAKITSLRPAYPAEGEPCNVSMGDALSVKICSSDGKVSSMIVTSRGAAGVRLLDQALVTMSGLVAPDATASDLARIKRSALTDLRGRDETTLCPSTRCFVISRLGDGWFLGANAGQ